MLRSLRFLSVTLVLLLLIVSGINVLKPKEVLGAGTVSLISHTKKVGTGASPAIDTTGATLLVIQEVRYGLTPTAPTDSAGNTWTALPDHVDGTSYHARYYYVCSPNTSATHTFTPGSSSWTAVAAFSGTATSNCFDSGTDKSAKVPSGSATGVLPAITPSQTGDLIISGIAENTFGADSPTVNQSLSIVETNPSNGANAFAWTQYNSVSPLTVSWTVHNSPDAEMIIAAFKAAPDSGGSAPTVSSFTANPTNISGGQSSILSWTVSSDTTSLSINNGVGNQSGIPSGSVSVSPTTTTTYILTATNSFGSTNSTTTVSVNSSSGGSASWTDLGPLSKLSLSSPQSCNNTTSPSYCNGIIYDYAGHFPAIMGAWGNAIARTKPGSEQLVFIGDGGHTDYLGNDIHSINLYTNPVSVSMLTTPSIPHASSSPVTTSNIQCQNPNPDGTPMSQHGYQNSTYLPKHDEGFFWAQGRSDWCIGNEAPGSDRLTWTFSFSDNTWHNMNPGGFDVKAGNDGTFASYVVLDPTTQDETVLVAWGLGGLGELLRYDRDTNTWSQLKPYGSYAWPTGGYAAIDPVRKLLVILGAASYTGGGGLKAVTVDISNSSYNFTDITSSLSGCSAANVLNPGMVYDPNTGNFKVYPGSGNSVLDFNPATGICTTQTVSGGPTDPLPGAGEWGKWQYFPTLNAFVNATQVSSNAFMFKMSGGSTTTPDTTSPIISLTAKDSNNQNITASSTVLGNLNFTVTASDPAVPNQTTSGISSITLSLDGIIIASSTTSTLNYSLNTRALLNTNHSLIATARDVAGNTTLSQTFQLNEIGFTALWQ